MKKIIQNFIVSILFFTTIICIYPNIVFASPTMGTDASGGGGQQSTVIIKPSDYKPGEITESTSFVNKSKSLIGAFQAIGTIVSVLALIITGIRYMLSSVEEKAEYKNTFIYYVVGAVLVFSISNISALLYNVATTLNK